MHGPQEDVSGTLLMVTDFGPTAGIAATLVLLPPRCCCHLGAASREVFRTVAVSLRDTAMPESILKHGGSDELAGWD